MTYCYCYAFYSTYFQGVHDLGKKQLSPFPFRLSSKSRPHDIDEQTLLRGIVNHSNSNSESQIESQVESQVDSD